MNFKKIIFDNNLNKAMGICSFCKNETPVPLYCSKAFRKELLYINEE